MPPCIFIYLFICIQNDVKRKISDKNKECDFRLLLVYEYFFNPNPGVDTVIGRDKRIKQIMYASVYIYLFVFKMM